MVDKDKKILGTLTVGQSPRVDLIPEMKQFVGADVEIIEAGALDGLTLGEVQRMHPEPGDYMLVTRMADGTQVKIGEKHMLPKMQGKIDWLVQQGAQVVALVCTGEFPQFECDRLLIEPQKVLFNTVKSVAQGQRLGVFIPDSEQVKQAKLRWSSVNGHVFVQPASPYGCPGGKLAAAERLKQAGVQMAVLDCIGYTLGDKQAVQGILGVPVVLARSVVARVIAELL
ncbi:MAG TPA: AroM family protein [Firmicutes bacterium]|nr:AroM family protein [Candidatus Fermentithermobacillaceae bacterium]